MRITALKTFRNQFSKGDIIQRGTSVEVDDNYGETLVRSGLATNSAKALKEYENKMLADYQDKGLPVRVETYEERTQGLIGPNKKSEDPEERTQGKAQGKELDAKNAKISEAKETPNLGAVLSPPPQPKATPIPATGPRKKDDDNK